MCSCRFEVQFSTSLSQALQGLGIRKPFDGGDITQVCHWPSWRFSDTAPAAMPCFEASHTCLHGCLPAGLPVSMAGVLLGGT
jgi:hypothetical protein